MAIGPCPNAIGVAVNTPGPVMRTWNDVMYPLLDRTVVRPAVSMVSNVMTVTAEQSNGRLVGAVGQSVKSDCSDLNDPSYSGPRTLAAWATGLWRTIAATAIEMVPKV